MIRKLLCFIGWHSWKWTLQKDEIIYIDKVYGVDGGDYIPDRAICRYCGKKYSK